MNYLATSVNTSPVITGQAGAAIADARGHALSFDTNGNVILAAAGAAPVGIGIMTNGDQGAVAQGADVDIQIHGIGLVCAGAAITKGTNLAVGANGAFVAASGSTGVAAIALEAAPAAGTYIKAILRF